MQLPFTCRKFDGVCYSVLCLVNSYFLKPFFQAFWDYEDKKQLRTTRAELSVTSEWSPDGCYFMTATTAPRLQVDNGYVDLRLYCEISFSLLLSLFLLGCEIS